MPIDVECSSCGQKFTSEVEPKFCVNCGSQISFDQETTPAPTHQLENGYTFSGELNERGLPTGQGILSNENESIEGDFVDGLVIGTAKQISNLRSADDHRVYVGGFQNNLRHGFGRNTHRFGIYFEGNWVRGVMQGPGSQRFIDGAILTGEYVDGSCVRGVEKHLNGCEYRGTYVKGNKEGLGNETFSNGSSYEGEYRDNYFHGKGRFTFPWGKVWSGEFIRHRGKVEGGTANFWQILCDDGSEHFGQVENDGHYKSYKLKRALRPKAFWPAY